MKAPSAPFHGPFSRSLDIHTVGSRIGLTWIEWEHNGPESIRSRLVDGDQVVWERRLPVPSGSASARARSLFRADGSAEVFWTAYERGAERLCHSAVPESPGIVLPAGAGLHLGPFTVTRGAAPSETWLAVQVWRRSGAGIEVWRGVDGSWYHRPVCGLGGASATDPAAAVSALWLHLNSIISTLSGNSTARSIRPSLVRSSQSALTSDAEIIR